MKEVPYTKEYYESYIERLRGEIDGLREELQKEKDAQCDACAENHHEMKRLREDNERALELLERWVGRRPGWPPDYDTIAFLNGEDSE